MKTSELCKLLLKNGCELIKHGANHDIWKNNKTGVSFTVPRHGSKEVPKGTELKIKKSAGIL